MRDFTALFPFSCALNVIDPHACTHGYPRIGPVLSAPCNSIKVPFTFTPSSTNLFIRYLPREVDDNRLREIFSVFGNITSSMVMRDIHSGQSLGTAFVRYEAHEEAVRALLLQRRCLLSQSFFTGKGVVRDYFASLSSCGVRGWQILV
ncbi:hypothetical protein LSCM1_06663 [Leishmania martiniquensis]|uniref:RRM domain-containing protein n=1 Tax=Leishmania martiniquensis TaxID=1580590 RepID=A0A836GVQ0_9TRYP|nr:hypothetical protein LSCM1_06663 [Leishmania martiniquensis]